MPEKITHLRISKFMLHKKKLFFISKKIQLIQKSYNQQCHPLHLGSEQYKQFPQKKKKKREKEREEERVRTGGKRRRKRRRKRRKGNKRRKKRKKWRERY